LLLLQWLARQRRRTLPMGRAPTGPWTRKPAEGRGRQAAVAVAAGEGTDTLRAARARARNRAPTEDEAGTRQVTLPLPLKASPLQQQHPNQASGQPRGAPTLRAARAQAPHRPPGSATLPPSQPTAPLQHGRRLPLRQGLLLRTMRRQAAPLQRRSTPQPAPACLTCTPLGRPRPTLARLAALPSPQQPGAAA